MKIYYLGVAFFVGSCIMALSSVAGHEKTTILGQCLGSEKLAGYEARRITHKATTHSWLLMSIDKRIADERKRCNRKAKEYFDK